ncbi:MAG: carboxymuconolactone decarboxylase family protein [Candidatus Microbacterium phytovorans]|uniref:Carboxymuconolactone decarboxylase family protein n=1 Tax=Candidatus Microbacterium phytovorans TaxID=3121374 RepID=A0AAJ6B3X8_9MICO|nr:carboxymuconolactone decarboxylase family protein [Microbacterium sp.]WEK14720.1 MAG: carboxymuconolactone decarboxylase family protein [Microbacterium sp.]
MIIQTPDPQSAEGYVAELYRGDLEDDGFVFSHTRAMAANAEALAAFEALIHAIVPSIGVRTYELATLAAAAALQSPHCLLAHGRKALRAGALDEDQLEAVARAGELVDIGGLSDADRAVMRHARKVSTAASAMTDADSQALRDVGFDDRQIVDITLAAAARNYFSRALQALAVPVETELVGLSPRLRDALLSPLND